MQWFAMVYDSSGEERADSPYRADRDRALLDLDRLAAEIPDDWTVKLMVIEDYEIREA